MPNFIEIKETFCGQMDIRTSSSILLLTFYLVTRSFEGQYNCHTDTCCTWYPNHSYTLYIQ